MRNIINPEALEPFLKRLKSKYPKLETFIDQNVRNYILRKDDEFVEKDEFIGSNLWFKKLHGEITPSERSMLEKQGIGGQYLKLALWENAFNHYCHLLDYANNLDAESLQRMNLADVRVQARRVEKKAQVEKQASFYELISGVDYRKVAEVGEDVLYELITLQAYKTEGKEMNHCVGTYVKPDYFNKMYSLRSKNHKGILTLQLKGHSLEVREAKGKNNSSPDGEKMSLAMAVLGAKPEKPDKIKKRLKIQSLLFSMIAIPFLYWVGKTCWEIKFYPSILFTGFYTWSHWFKVRDSYRAYRTCLRLNKEYDERQNKPIPLSIEK